MENKEIEARIRKILIEEECTFDEAIKRIAEEWRADIKLTIDKQCEFIGSHLDFVVPIYDGVMDYILRETFVDMVRKYMESSIK